METSGQRVVRVLDLPPSLVWSALVDPVLAEGWLHPVARLVPEGDTAEPPAVEVYDAPHTLRVDAPLLGRLCLELDPVPGGARGTSTRLTVELSGPAELSPADLGRAEEWRRRLERLHELLHGHPADWSTEDSERQAL